MKARCNHWSGEKNRGRESLLLLILQEGGFLSLKPCEPEVGDVSSGVTFGWMYVSAFWCLLFPPLNHVPWSQYIAFHLNISSTWSLGGKKKKSSTCPSLCFSLEHRHWSTSRPRHCGERLPPMPLTFCPFTPIVAVAPGWPCGRAPRLMTVMQQLW